ncbi:hypothetical protein HRbin12_01718 [bacterium HR12]|nr:hypothetical protein HRbin12_01718 [bacterium HR12]
MYAARLAAVPGVAGLAGSSGCPGPVGFAEPSAGRPWHVLQVAVTVFDASNA